MSKQQESIGRTLLVALLVCLVCSVVVSTAAVSLKPTQLVNRQLDKQRNILAIAGLADPTASGAEVQKIFAERIKPRVVDLKTGQFTDAQDATSFDPLVAAKDPALSDALPTEKDPAGIRRRERQSVVYLVEGDKGLETILLPIRGYALWSTLHGFIALKNDLNTVVGLGFYQHAETPGLGGEIDNPRWKALWPGKTVYDDSGKPVISVIKGSVDPNSAQATHQVDGLAGATLTSKGVDQLVKYWLGPEGFGPFLANLRAGDK
ncbi:MAG: Na(+)-translocating NADH-quinone reductase subunit C [Lautropia sp.]|nr:Na(+)-translocating NADH-quinone reductase subunit C [Lautropia sp.]